MIFPACLFLPSLKKYGYLCTKATINNQQSLWKNQTVIFQVTIQGK